MEGVIGERNDQESDAERGEGDNATFEKPVAMATPATQDDGRAR